MIIDSSEVFRIAASYFSNFVTPFSCLNLKKRRGGLGRRGGLEVVSLPLGRPARVRILARGLPKVWSEGRQITL